MGGEAECEYSRMYVGGGMPLAETNRIFFTDILQHKKTACIALYVIHADKIMAIFGVVSHVVCFVKSFFKKIDAFVLDVIKCPLLSASFQGIMMQIIDV